MKTMNNESNKLLPMVEILPPVVNLGCISPLSIFCSSFWYVLQSLFHLLLCMWKTKTASPSAEVPGDQRCTKCSDVIKQEHNTKTVGSDVVQQKCSNNNANDHANAGDEVLTTEELKTVMRNLGTSYDSHGDKIKGKLSSHDINALFEEQEPSAQEVEEAFQIFDENKDGFIDAKELRKMLLKLCLTQVSEDDCKRMIRAFDDNGDELIDLDEFVRLLTCSFS